MIDKVDNDISSSLKGGDKVTAQALKMLKNALVNARIAKKEALTDEEEQQVVRKEIKARIEARDIFANNNRQELADKEESERKLFSAYIPADLSQEQLDQAILTAYDSIGSVNEFPKLMPATMKIVAGKVDGKLVADSVKKFIEGKM